MADGHLPDNLKMLTVTTNYRVVCQHCEKDRYTDQEFHIAHLLRVTDLAGQAPPANEPGLEL